MRALIIASLALACLASPAAAEFYRCVGPNGEVRFTSDASQCPHAPPLAPKAGAVQRVQTKQQPLVSARPGSRSNASSPAAAAQSDSGSEQIWRQKKANAQQELAYITARLEYVQRALVWCNRGGGLYTESGRTGLRRNIECEEVDAELASTADCKRELEAYLAEGLEEECRHAGCLPGWLR